MQHKDTQYLIAVRRSPIYNVESYRMECNDIVLKQIRDFKYDMKGLEHTYIPILNLLPWLKDSPKEYWCSELCNHWLILNSNGAINIRNDRSLNDNCTPWDIQKSNLLIPVEKIDDFYPIRAMDIGITTSASELAEAIRLMSAGAGHVGDLSIGTHAFTFVVENGRFKAAEMIMNYGGMVNDLSKYEVR